MQKLTITGYSTALYATWYFVEELGVLFDAGDGVTAGLLQKSGKVRHVFLSHADRDHLSGILQFNQLNADVMPPTYYYPTHSGSFPALRQFGQQFDPYTVGVQWLPIAPGDEIIIRDNIIVLPIRNSHVPVAEGIIKSLSYTVWQVKRKLKPELAHLPGPEIKKLKDALGEDGVTSEVRTNILSYSGDTPVEDADRWKDAEVLIHEATFLTAKGEPVVSKHGTKHSSLEQVIEMVSATNVQRLILGHFSVRYSAEEIEIEIKRLCDKYAINIPVYCVLPGELRRDILQTAPVNK